MGRSTGSEPATSGTTNQRSNQLSYDRHYVEGLALHRADGHLSALPGSVKHPFAAFPCDFREGHK